MNIKAPDIVAPEYLALRRTTGRVRRTEVEVEDERRRGGAGGSSAGRAAAERTRDPGRGA
jgi:hypothetical protein